ncbi:hypothetical protein Sjap_012871 [Stephania japonica]|uniref:Crossover junction endonuclease MUS81 n=1 Tax=Stephania japonica TaxID=461633 RepID=A0AAP0IWZ2_9MAGN
MDTNPSRCENEGTTTPPESETSRRSFCSLKSPQHKKPTRDCHSRRNTNRSLLTLHSNVRLKNPRNQDFDLLLQSMEKQRRVVCDENEQLATFMWNKRQEMVDTNGVSERIDMTLHKAYSNVCTSKVPIKTLKDFSQIKGVGKWVLRLMQEFFKRDSGSSEGDELPEKGRKVRRSKRYVPQKNSVPYALLVTLHRAIENGAEYMKKQELIDAAEASGLSRVPIAPELGKGKLSQFGSSPREWYSGWSSMKMLIAKGLVAKSSCPAKYMLTTEGRESALECLSRSGVVDQGDHLARGERLLSDNNQLSPNLQCSHTDLFEKGDECLSSGLSAPKKKIDIPTAFLETKFILENVIPSTKKVQLFRLERLQCSKGIQVDIANHNMGHSEEQIFSAFGKASKDNKKVDISSLWSATLHHLRKDRMDALLSECRQTLPSSSVRFKNVAEVDHLVEERSQTGSVRGAEFNPDSLCSVDSTESRFNLKACSSNDMPAYKFHKSDKSEVSVNCLMVPPLGPGERFGDVYDVRRLPVGDGIWIARHKHVENEYVLDFIVERKNVDDLRHSIRDNRYRDQKLRLLRCGLRKIIYLVEGDPNFSEAAESIKTACFTTEILEGFDVQRTSGLGDTLKRYGHLTLAITDYYRALSSNIEMNKARICPQFKEYVRRCQDLEKMTVSDVFAIQLMQVPQVTEDIALAIIDMYPTVISLALAYSHLEGDVRAQEEMLHKESNNLVSADIDDCEAVLPLLRWSRDSVDGAVEGGGGASKSLGKRYKLLGLRYGQTEDGRTKPSFDLRRFAVVAV